MVRRVLRCALLALVAAWIVACGGAPAPAPTVRAAPRPSGDARSFLAPYDLRFAVDFAAVRMTPFADDAGALARAAGIFQRFAGGALIDPVRDIDLAGASTREASWGSRGVVGERWRLVLRHRLEDEDALGRLERGALANGEALRWRESQGVRSALLPGEAARATPHVVMLSAPHEVVVVPEDELIDAVAIARDQLAHRITPDDVVEPVFVLAPRVFATADVTTLPPLLAGRGALSASGTALWTGTEVQVEIIVRFGSSAAAASAQTDLTTTLSQFRGNNPFLVSLGLAGWVDRTALAVVGDTLVLTTSGDGAESTALCRALAALASS